MTMIVAHPIISRNIGIAMSIYQNWVYIIAMWSGDKSVIDDIQKRQQNVSQLYKILLTNQSKVLRCKNKSEWINCNELVIVAVKKKLLSFQNPPSHDCGALLLTNLRTNQSGKINWKVQWLENRMKTFPLTTDRGWSHRFRVTHICMLVKFKFKAFINKCAWLSNARTTCCIKSQSICFAAPAIRTTTTLTAQTPDEFMQMHVISFSCMAIHPVSSFCATFRRPWDATNSLWNNRIILAVNHSSIFTPVISQIHRRWTIWQHHCRKSFLLDTQIAFQRFQYAFFQNFHFGNAFWERKIISFC